MSGSAVRLRAADISEDEKKAAASVMGSIRTEKKASSSRGNLAKRPPEKMGGLTPKPLLSLACSCGVGDTLEGHKWSCPRGQAIKRRIKEGRDILTGALPTAMVSK
jgi:hypothetical protein